MATTDQHLERAGIVVERGHLAAFTTVDNTYVTVDTVGCMLFKTKQIALTVTVHDLTVKVLGSLDGGATFPLSVLDETPIATNATLIATSTAIITHFRVQAKPTVADVDGILNVNYVLATF